VLLADVAGKGMPAALLGASLHASVRANAPAAGEHCGGVLAKANMLLFETTSSDRFATVFYGVYDTTNRTMSFANAGHYPPMLVRGGECIRLKSLTPPIGMLPTLPAVDDRVELQSGDWLLVFSDGIPEAEDEGGEEFGDEGLPTALAQAKDGSASEACRNIVETVRNHVREQRQPDDITLIAIRVS
jgi:sigma-B regulation protein RsbU (phosphoserine phosphatase)